MPVRLKGFRTRIDLVQHNPVGLVMRYDYLEFQRTLVTISFGVPFGSHRQHRVELRIALRLRREGHTPPPPPIASEVTAAHDAILDSSPARSSRNRATDSQVRVTLVVAVGILRRSRAQIAAFDRLAAQHAESLW